MKLMTKTDQKNEGKPLPNDKNFQQNEELEKEETFESKLHVAEDKLLRTLAEMENQRRRFEKERQEAFEFGGFNLAKESLAVLDNIDRAVISFKNDEI
jgi:molecular chaperone GrpE